MLIALATLTKRGYPYTMLTFV